MHRPGNQPHGPWLSFSQRLCQHFGIVRMPLSFRIGYFRSKQWCRPCQIINRGMNGNYQLDVTEKVHVPTLIPHTDVAMRMAILMRGAIAICRFTTRWILAHKQPITNKRTVVIDNENECTVKEHVGVGANCPELVAMCDGELGARCQDEI